MITLMVHLLNQELIKLDVDDTPHPTDNSLIGKNPRDKTDKELPWLEDGVTTIVFPWWRVTFVEVLPSPSDEAEFPLPFRND